MKRGIDAHLRRYRMMLNSIDAKGSAAEVIWRSAKLGSWQSISPRWWEAGGKIRFRFKAFERNLLFWVSSIQQAADGLKILLTNPRGPLPEALQITWSGTSPEAGLHPEGTWMLAQRWFRERFPGCEILSASRRPDLTWSLSVHSSAWSLELAERTTLLSSRTPRLRMTIPDQP